MKRVIAIGNKESVKDGLIALGQELIRRAEDITNDIENVISISVYANINPGEIVNFDITKNYAAMLEEEVEEEK